MAYRVKCDKYQLLDARQDDLMIYDPRVTVEVNTVGEASFTIYSNHPYFGELHMMKSVFEISDDLGVIFRGRMTSNTYDFDNGKAVDLEGAMAFFNDSIVRPFNFPDDWKDDAKYGQAAESGNVIAFFLEWLIEQHNLQVGEFQRFKLGNVTVTDENNYITRSNSDYANTWDTLKNKLFGSSLGGYLCIRYESDGNYIDYLSEFTRINPQKIEFGKNLLDLKNEISASDTYTAAIPLGAKIGEENAQKRFTIEEIDDGDVTDDIVKKADYIYSKSAVQQYGWIYAPISDTTWDDVTDARNLLKKASDYMSSFGKMLTGVIELSAVDLHFTSEQIQSFRIYRKIEVLSDPHGLSESYDLTKLDIDILNPQNTKITIGERRKTLTQNIEGDSNRIGTVEKNYELNKEMIESSKSLTVTLSNESHVISTDSSGAGGDFTDCKTTLQAFYGTADVTNDATYLVTKSDGIAGTWSESTHTCKVDSLTGDNGYIDFTVSYKNLSVTKRFVVSKAKGGRDGTDAAVLRIESSRGTVFKNNMVSTVLTAAIHCGGERITDITALKSRFGTSAYIEWSWQRMDEDRFGVISASDSRIGDSGFSFTLSPEDVDTKVTFMCRLIAD